MALLFLLLLTSCVENDYTIVYEDFEDLPPNCYTKNYKIARNGAEIYRVRDPNDSLIAVEQTLLMAKVRVDIEVERSIKKFYHNK